MASAYVTLRRGAQELGTYLVSLHLPTPQRVDVDGKTYQVALRFKRYYKPYTVALLRFDHDKYLGTEIPKNYSSRVRLRDPGNGAQGPASQVSRRCKAPPSLLAVASGRDRKSR